MGKQDRGKDGQKKGGATVSGPFAGTYWRLRRPARGRRLFVLFDGDPAAPRLTFFDTTRGVSLLEYRPASRAWARADRPRRGGRCEEHAGVIAVAARLAGSRRSPRGPNRDLSEFGTPA